MHLHCVCNAYSMSEQGMRNAYAMHMQCVHNAYLGVLMSTHKYS